MIELVCPTCKNIFERRGHRRGKYPDCNECRNSKEQERIKGIVKNKVYRIPPEFCATDKINLYLQGKIDERQEILEVIK